MAQSRVYIEEEGDRALYSRQIDQVDSWAQRLERAVTRVGRLAGNYSPGFDRRERAAMELVYDLEAAASRFQERVDQGYRNPARTEREFRRLLRAYGEAANAMEYLRDYDDAYMAFRDVQMVMNRLVDYYGGYDEYAYRYSGRGYRYDAPDLRINLGPLSFDID
jgi:3-deoxy-D-arabino-heptulosonate 7-phosphate (DAHP) synthase class II